MPVPPGVPVGLSLLLGNDLFHPSMYGKRAAIKAVGGYGSVSAEDYDLWMRLVLGGFSLRISATPVIAYRRHATQISRSPEWVAKMKSELSDSPMALTFAQLQTSQLPAPSRDPAVLAAILRIEPSPLGLEYASVVSNVARGQQLCQTGSTQSRCTSHQLRTPPQCLQSLVGTTHQTGAECRTFWPKVGPSFARRFRSRDL